MSINLDTYYRGLAAQRLQQLADELLSLSREAEQADAHDAAFHLADLSTQLLDMGVEATRPTIT
jgi:signal transduction histidine kinase